MSEITYGTYTITNESEGSQFWTASQAPTTPDYTFTIANLTGDTNADIKVGDIIFQGHYMYTVLSVDSTTVRAGNRVSIKGADAISPTIKSIVCSHAAAVCGKDGTYNPATIQFSGQAQQEETITAYSGYFVIDISSDGSTWVRDYAPTTKATSTNYTIPLGVNISKNGVIYPQGTVSQSGTVLNTNFTITSEGVVTTTEDVGFIIRSIRCSLYADYDNSNQTYSNLVDQQRVNIAFDGVDGDKGDDAYSITLTNENYTFSGNTTSAVQSNTNTGFNVAECNVIAYYGGTLMPCTIGTITGAPTGMTATISNNNSTGAKFTVTVDNTMTTQNGVLNVPITVDNKLFNMTFSYSLKLNGLDSTGLGMKTNYSTLNTQTNGTCVYYAYEDGTKTPIMDVGVNGWVIWNGQEVLIPTGCYINSPATVNPSPSTIDPMPTGQTIYSVYRLNNASNPANGGVFHDVTYMPYENLWKYNTYSGSIPTLSNTAWTWDETTDIILSMYVIPSSGNKIMNAQLFTPPKKYSELAEMAIEDSAKTVTRYKVNAEDGLFVHPENDTSDGVRIQNTVNVIRGGVSVAEYGANVRIGKDGNNENRIVIDNTNSKIDIIKSGTSVASFSDSVQVGKDSSGHTNITTSGMTVYGGNGTQRLANIGYGEGIDQNGQTSIAPYYELGERKANTAIGNWSTLEGKNNEASASYTHVEGIGCTASEYASHAGGMGSTANGLASFVHGRNVTANYDSQAVFGKNNVQNNKAVFQVGIGGFSYGYDGMNPSNCNGLELLQNGCLNIYGAIKTGLSFANKTDFKKKIVDGANEMLVSHVPYIFSCEASLSQSIFSDNQADGMCWGLIFCYSGATVHLLFMYKGKLYRTSYSLNTDSFNTPTLIG